MKATETTENSEVTQKQIDAWKKLHGEIFEIEVEDAKAWVKKPNRKILSHALSVSKSGQDGMKFNEIVLRDTWLGGDDRIIEDDDYFFAASQQLDELLKYKTASIKKL